MKYSRKSIAPSTQNKNKVLVIASLGGVFFTLIPCISITWALPPSEELNIYFATRDNNGITIPHPSQNFNCYDYVYLIVKTDNAAWEGLTISTHWEKINTPIEFSTQRQFTSNGHHGYWAWGGIYFKENQKSIFSSFNSFLNPASEMEKFIGNWKVSLRIKNKLITTKEVVFLC